MARGRAANFTPLSTEEARKRGKNGGEKSGVARKKKKKLREYLDALLERQIGDMNTAEAITVALVKKALTGDVKAYETIRDTIGEKPTDRIEHSGGIDLIAAIKEGNRRVEKGRTNT